MTSAMAKTLLSRIISSTQLRPQLCIFGYAQNRKLSTNEVPVKEVQIPVQYGHLAAKYWGEGPERPILAIHGWQDNAGTWDTLIPMLYKEAKLTRPVIAIDLPGHGLSSWYPGGMTYNAWEYPRLILYIKDHFKWDKVSIMGHSMGSIASWRFASIFPNDVDFYIAVDSLIYDDYDLNLVVDKYETILKKNNLSQVHLHEEPPSYSLEEIIQRWHLGTNKSVSVDTVPYLLKRGAMASLKDPNKYYFSRDPRLKHVLFNPENKLFVEAIALRLKCPTLYFKGTSSPYASDPFAVATRELMEKNNDKFETHFVPGTHHVHLNNPERLVPHIINFFKKHNLS